jgi:iron(III) transport system substrate-binding protein
VKKAAEWSAIFFAAILSGPVAARGASAPKPWGPMNEIEAAAKKEARLVIYAAPGHANGDTQRAMSQHFQQKYGITVDWTGIDARDIAPRVLAEQRTKNYVADLVMTGYGGACTPIKAGGYIEPILAPSTMEKAVWRLDPLAATPKERDWAFIFMPLIPSFFVNTAMVTPAEEPKSYQDLLHPKWKGKIVLQTPSVGGSGSGWFQPTYRTLGLDYMRALAKQVATVPQVNDVPDQVARGQYAIGLGASTGRGRELVREGAPVKFVQPKEGSHLAYIGACALAPVTHPNAAKLFLNWLYTKEGQTLYTKPMNAIPLRKDVSQEHVAPNERYTEGQPFMARAVEDLTDQRAYELYALGKQIFDEKK